MSEYGRTTKVRDQLQGLVHKTNQVVSGKTKYQERFEAINFEKTEKYKLQKKLKDQFQRQIQGGGVNEDGDDDMDGKYFYENEYNLPEDVIQYVMKFFVVEEKKTKNQSLTEWQLFYKKRNDFDKSRLQKLIFEIYDRRKQEQEYTKLFIKPIQWIDEVEKTAEKMYELEIRDLDYVVDQDLSFEQVSELPLLTWEDQIFKPREQNVEDIKYLMDKSQIKPPKTDDSSREVDLVIRDQRYILEDDEDKNFSREIQQVQDQVRMTVHLYNKELYQDQVLTKSIERLMRLDSYEGGSNHQSLSHSIQILQESNPKIGSEEDIQRCLELMSKRELTPLQAQQRLNLSEEQLKQMYILYQKAKHFDKMQEKFQRLKIEHEKQIEELKKQMVEHQHFKPNTVYNPNQLNDFQPNQFPNAQVNQSAPWDVLIQHHPLLNVQNYLQQLPQIIQEAPLSQQMIQKPQRNDSQQINDHQSRNQSVILGNAVSSQMDHYTKINEQFYMNLMRELKIKLNSQLNQKDKQIEAQLTQSKIFELQQLYQTSTNPNILFYQLKQFKESMQPIQIDES